MGEVFLARDTKLGREVALKLLPAEMSADETARARLLNEARTASSLNHPHICTIFEVGEAEGRAYIALEHVEGKPLAAMVPEGGLPADAVLRYGTQIADALAHAHDRGVIHRDLKTSNVMITPDGRAKVLDFGLAKKLRDEDLTEVTRSGKGLTQAGAVVGTLHSMAPELLSGNPADERSDIWALGILLYETAAGALPFQGKTGFEMTSAILREPPRILPERVPAGLRAVIQRCLAKEPGHRYQRASEVRAALEAIGSGTIATA
jgi:serine/threonine protein kinase